MPKLTRVQMKQIQKEARKIREKSGKSQVIITVYKMKQKDAVKTAANKLLRNAPTKRKRRSKKSGNNLQRKLRF